MPYIKQKDREKFTNLENELLFAVPSNAGELNYLFTKIAHLYLTKQGTNYQAFNDLLGALEGAKLELYRRKTAPYEDDKIEYNGDV